jgi:protein-tyrosine phosphatase
MAGRAEVHFHILPGVDDGPATLADSILLAGLALADGTVTVVATPHVCDIDVGELGERVHALRAELARERLPLEVLPGGEAAAGDVAGLSDVELEVIAQGPAHARWVLLESPHDETAGAFGEAADELRARGFGVVVAHPERSAALEYGNGDLIRRELALGSWLQVNGMSVMGRYGDTVRQAALRLLANEERVVLASDAHGESRPPCLSEAIRRARADGVPVRRLRSAGNTGPRKLLRAGVASRPSQTVSYLNCPACRLSLRARETSPAACPRCMKRDKLAVPLFASPLPYRHLAGSILDPPPHARPG